MNPIFIALAVALGISVLGNALQGVAYLDTRDDLATAIAEREHSRGAAASCSAGTTKLRDLADKRAKEAGAARARADDQARTHEQRAQEILASAPAIAGDDCKSAALAIQAWRQRRAKP